MSCPLVRRRCLPFTGTYRRGVCEAVFTLLVRCGSRLTYWALRRLPMRPRIELLASRYRRLDYEIDVVGTRILAEAERAGIDASIHENDPFVAAEVLEYTGGRPDRPVFAAGTQAERPQLGRTLAGGSLRAIDGNSNRAAAARTTAGTSPRPSTAW